MTSLFLSIVNRSIAVGITILAVIAVRALTRRSPKWTRGILWAIVALQLILPFTLHSAVSIVPELPQFSQGEEAYNPIEPEISKPAPSVGKLPELSTALPEHTDSVTAKPTEPQVIPQDTAQSEPQATPQVTTQDTVQTTPQNVSAAQSGVTAADIFAIIWLVGAAAMLMYLAVGYIRLWASLRGSVRTSDGIWHSDITSTAFVFGVLRPRIYLPGKTEPGARECMIAHERAHIRRGDHITKLLAFLLLSVYWFNPLVWIAYILFCRDIELACDERAIRGTEPAHMQEYARALLSESGVKKTVAAYPLSFGGHSLKTRIKNILNYKKPPFWVIVATLLVSALTAACFATAPIEKEANAPVSAPSETETEPVGTETKPVKVETKPVKTGVKPAETETKPVETETKLIETETEPVETEPEPTEPITEATVPPTEAPTELITEAPTQALTEVPTEPVTETSTEPKPTEWVPHPVGSTKYKTTPRTELPKTASQVKYTNGYSSSTYSFGHEFDYLRIHVAGEKDSEDRLVIFCVANTYDELLSIEDYFRNPYIGNDEEDKELSSHYDEKYFKDRSVIFFCGINASSGDCTYPVKLYRIGTELCISAKTDVHRGNDGWYSFAYTPVVIYSYELMEIDKSTLNGIDTLSCYITANSPAFPFEIRDGYNSGFAGGTPIAHTLSYHKKGVLGEFLGHKMSNNIRGFVAEDIATNSELLANTEIICSVVSDAESLADNFSWNSNAREHADYAKLISKYNSRFFANHQLILIGWVDYTARGWNFKGLSRSGDELCAQFTVNEYGKNDKKDPSPYALTVIEVEKKALDGIGGFSFYVEKK